MIVASIRKYVSQIVALTRWFRINLNATNICDCSTIYVYFYCYSYVLIIIFYNSLIQFFK